MDLFVKEEREVPLEERKGYLAKIKQLIASKICSITKKTVKETFFMLERPKKDVHGHIMIPVVRLKAVDLQKTSFEIISSLKENKEIAENIDKIEQKGLFINIFLKIEKAMPQIIKEIENQKECYGNINIGRKKKIIIDTSSPNISKPFHVGHLRSTVIGRFLKNIYEVCGYNAVTLNYLGDWGKTFGLLAVGYKKYGDEKKLLTDPIGHMFDVYVNINKDGEKDKIVHDQAREYFKKMEERGEEELKMWKVFKDKSIVAYRKIYSDFNVEFDIWSGESFYEGKMDKVIDELKENKLLVESKNALCVDLQEKGLGMVMIKKADGASLYITRDLAAAEDRAVNMEADRLVYVVSSQQDLHFQQLFEVLTKMKKKYAEGCVHINYGLIRGMKTRTGNVVFLEDVFNEVKEKISNEMKKNQEKYKQIESPEEVAKILAASSIIVQDMSARRIKDYDFQIERVVSFEGDTGPYLQYTHARLSSVERKAGCLDLTSVDLTLLKEEIVKDTVLFLGRYPEIVVESFLSSEPCVIVGYLMKLSHLTSSCLEKIWVAGQEEKIMKARLLFYRTVKTVMSNGMKIVGLIPLDRM